MIGNELFDEATWETYRAVADRLVPADDFPSAWDAGAGEFLKKQLAGELARLREPVLRAIETVDAAARRGDAARFVDLDDARQDTIIEALERSDDESERRGIGLLIDLTLESYYANPENGGNRNEVSWQMIGYTRRPGRPFGRAGSAT